MLEEADKREFRELIAEGFKSQREWLEATLNPIQKSQDYHKEIIQEVPVIKQKLENHLDNHDTERRRKTTSSELWVVVGVFIVDKILQYFPTL